MISHNENVTQIFSRANKQQQNSEHSTHIILQCI